MSGDDVLEGVRCPILIVKMHLFDFLSIMPKTQCPSTYLPWLYLRLKKWLSSISTTTGSPLSSKPPSCIGFRISHLVHSSLQKLYQSTNLGLLMPVSLEVVFCGVSMAQ